MNGEFNTAWLLALAFAVPALAATGNATVPVPGTVNYVEGYVASNGSQLHSGNTTVLEANQMLDTKQGKAELLLIPGAYLRVGNESRIRMVAAGLADTRVELVRGSALLEVDDIHKENNLS